MDPMEMVARFHGTLIRLERFDRENIRPKIETKANHPPREFAIVSSYLRILAHVRTLIELKSASHFQAIATITRSIFELAVDIRVLDRIEIANAAEKYSTFSDTERLRSARQIVKFHNSGKMPRPLKHLPVYEKFIEENAQAIEERAGKLWPKGPPSRHWSGLDLRSRSILLGAPFDELYDVHYAELSWYAHPGVGAIASFDVEIYPVVCGSAYGVAVRCYVETLLFMINELKLGESDPLIEKKLEFERMAAFADEAEQAAELRRELLGA